MTSLALLFIISGYQLEKTPLKPVFHAQNVAPQAFKSTRAIVIGVQKSVIATNRHMVFFFNESLSQRADIYRRVVDNLGKIEGLGNSHTVLLEQQQAILSRLDRLIQENKDLNDQRLEILERIAEAEARNDDLSERYEDSRTRHIKLWNWAVNRYGQTHRPNRCNSIK